jgi:hypothetical protein
VRRTKPLRRPVRRSVGATRLRPACTRQPPHVLGIRATSSLCRTSPRCRPVAGSGRADQAGVSSSSARATAWSSGRACPSAQAASKVALSAAARTASTPPAATLGHRRCRLVD